MKHHQEMIAFLQQYLRINTAQPNPAYDQVGILFENDTNNTALLFRRYSLPSGYPCFLVTATGNNPTLPALLLNHHMDVVPTVEHSAWIADPFDGALINNTIVARGVQDTKGLGVVHYFALKRFIKEHRLARSIHILIVPDEERGGFGGTEQIIAQPFFEDLNIGFVFDEGPSSGNPHELLIKIDERRPLQIQITTSGTAGHGSHLYIDNALHKMATILAALAAYQQNQKFDANLNVGMTTSCNITDMGSNNRHNTYNMVPSHAYANIDIRLAPNHTRSDMELMLNALCETQSAAYTVLASVPERAYAGEKNFFLYDIARSINKKYAFTTRAIVSEGASDLRFYWECGIPGIGFAPFTSVYNAHGINESLTVEELIKAEHIMFDLIHALNR